MGQRRLSVPQADNSAKRPQTTKKSNNAVLNSTSTRKGEVFKLNVEHQKTSTCRLASTS